ncbi:hypothetical protein NHX12_012978 [Muraenolepis orangiensis]|uniref:Uncharacterized protein n=1 Tax=Muraenolepis orangiensis TaxID=630683 RepID=A0A9Q0DDX0_9TELE|nr:hypothetical protein NHX12_012978 [Muraenolepis orangiensis]
MLGPKQLRQQSQQGPEVWPGTAGGVAWDRWRCGLGPREVWPGTAGGVAWDRWRRERQRSRANRTTMCLYPEGKCSNGCSKYFHGPRSERCCIQNVMGRVSVTRTLDGVRLETPIMGLSKRGVYRVFTGSL